MPLTVVEAARGLRDRSFSAAELVEQTIRHADRLDASLHLYAARFDEEARAAAAAADRDFAAGVDRGPLQGIPIGVKDMILTREAPTGAGSKVDNPAWRERRDATVIARLRRAGAVITGKTTTAELAVGTPMPDRLGSEARNPWDADRWAGGSSAGSGAGVGAGAFLIGIGSDTGGSIRLPAAYCGIAGLRPTLGRLSLAGVIPLSLSLDVVGPMARTAADVAATLQIMAGPDPTAPVTISDAIPDFSQGLGRPITGLRVGVVRMHHFAGDAAIPETAACFGAAVRELESAGAVLREVELPYYEQGVNAVLATLFAEGFAYHANELREQWEAFGASTRRALGNGALLNSGDYVMAQKVRGAIRRLLADVYADVDVIVCPTARTGAPRVEGISLHELDSVICTNYWSATGNPVISIPIGFTDHGMPLGMQIAGRHFDESTLLRAADAYQRTTDWHLRVPPMVAAITAGEESDAVRARA